MEKKKKRVLQESIFSHFTSDARLFITSKRNLLIESVDTVNLEADIKIFKKRSIQDINLASVYEEIEELPRQFQLEVYEPSRSHG